MLSFIKQVFIVLLGFIVSLVHVPKISDQTKCLSLKSIADTLLIEIDEIISVMDIVSAKVTNRTIVTNATNATKIVIVKR